MEPLWNQLNLNKPPTSSWETTTKNFDANNFVHYLKTVYRDLESQEILQTEAAVLSRLIYRMKSKFRSDKGLKNMEKVNRALLNYLKLALEKDYKNLLDIITFTAGSVALPTRQMLQYVLTRTQGFAKLMCRVENVAQAAANFLMSRIRLGQAWTVSVISHSVISRIWLLSRCLVQKCCIWYSTIFPYVEKLKLIGLNWLPSTCCLPSDLKTWLAVPWIDDEIPSVPTNQQLKDSIFNLIKHQDDLSESLQQSEFTEELLDVAEDKSEINKLTTAQLSQPVPDMGERISRDSFEANAITQVSPRLEKMKTQKDLELLTKLEAYPGLDKLQWSMIKKIINKKLFKIEQCKDSDKKKVILHKIFVSLKKYIN